MRKRSLRFYVILLFLAKALLLCLILPPWMGPDEAIRLEYARLFSLAGLRTLTPEAMPANQSEVLRSMSQFKAWDFMDLPQPDEAGHRSFKESPLHKDSASTSYPPLYYLLLGNLWREAGVRGLLPQLYTGRFISLALGVLQLALLVPLARRAWPSSNQESRLCAVVFMAFLPQWGYLSSSVHSDNWSNMLAACMMLLFQRLLDGHGHSLDTEGTSIARRRFYVSRAAALAVALVLMVLSTRATAIIAAILGVSAAPGFIQKLRRSVGIRRKTILLLTVGLVLVAVFAWLLLDRIAKVPDELEEAMGRGLMQRGAAIPTQELGTILSRMGEVTVANCIRSSVVLFSTFWLALGTVVYKLSLGWLAALAVISTICVIGWLRRPTLFRAVRNDPFWLLLWTAPITTLAAVFYLYGPHQPYAPEGRYLLLVMPAIAILMTEGWRRFFNGETRRLALAAWICGWVFLDGIALFRYIIPIYYL